MIKGKVYSKNEKYYRSVFCYVFKREEKSIGCCRDQVSHVKLRIILRISCVECDIYELLKLESMRKVFCALL